MSDYLNKKDIDNLMKLFNAIKLDLSDDSFPTRTNRLEAVENMKKVIEIHGYKVVEVEPESQEEELKMPFPDAEDISKDKHQGRVEPDDWIADARDQHLIRQNLNKATGGK